MDTSSEFQLILDKAIESEPLAFKTFDRTKNVQGQLQEMMGSFEETINLYKYFSQFNSREQLWLAFVMKNRFGVTWDGERWILKK